MKTITKKATKMIQGRILGRYFKRNLGVILVMVMIIATQGGCASKKEEDSERDYMQQCFERESFFLFIPGVEVSPYRIKIDQVEVLDSEMCGIRYHVVIDSKKNSRIRRSPEGLSQFEAKHGEVYSKLRDNVELVLLDVYHFEIVKEYSSKDNLFNFAQYLEDVHYYIESHDFCDKQKSEIYRYLIFSLAQGSPSSKSDLEAVFPKNNHD